MATSNNKFTASLMRGDKYLWGIYLTLATISIVEMFSASSILAYKAASNSDPAFSHLTNIFFGVIAILVFQNLNTKAIRNWGIFFFIGGVILLLITPILGVSQKGATRSIFGIQPAEIIKVGLMLFLCSCLTIKDAVFQRFSLFRYQTEMRRFFFLLACIGIVCIPIMFQNLSTALIIGFVSICLLFLGGVRYRYLIRLLLVIVVVALLGLAALFGLHVMNTADRKAGVEQIDLYFLNRAHTWESRIFGSSTVPLYEANRNGERSQELYASMALANSKGLGKGLGNSQIRDFLPEAYSDYIFAIIFEEGGFLGAAGVIFIYLFLLFRCFQLSKRTDDPFIRMVMVAIPLLIVTQALIHIGVCTGAMFVTGQPLPLLSRGGSSILFTSISFGILFALSRVIENEVAGRRQPTTEFVTAEDTTDSDTMLPEEAITDRFQSSSQS